MIISELRNLEPQEKYLIRINLQFFEEEKTEAPTEKRTRKAIKDGQFAVSKDLVTAMSVILCFTSLKWSIPRMYEQISTVMLRNFTLIENYEILRNDQYYHTFAMDIFSTAISIVAPVAAVAIIVGLAMNLLQTGWHPRMDRVKLNFKAIMPKNPLKKIFNKDNLVQAGLGILKIIILGYIVCNKLIKEVFMIQNIIYYDFVTAIMYVGELCFDVSLLVGYTFFVLSLADLAYQRYKHNEKMKMSKTEVKDERKQSEGDPMVKAKIRQKMREAALMRMMSSVPKADVVITNPTHYAVAIKYEREKEGAPVVVAKGKDHLALKIKQHAIDNGVEIVENKPLARALYASVEVDREIPPELYQAVAEVLAFVYKLKNKV